MKNDPYNILGVNNNATSAEIRSAYLKLAKKYHPDINPSAEAKDKMKAINEAYEILSDSNKKAQYDQFGNTDGQNPYGNYGHHDSYGDQDSGFDSFFGNMFNFNNQGGRAQNNARGQDIIFRLTINLEDVFAGITKTINYDRLEKCKACEGYGSMQSSVNTCNKCHGTGAQTVNVGFMHLNSVCGACGGSGKRGSVCKDCNGNCRIKTVHSVTIVVPKGVENGAELTMKQMGDAGVGSGAYGDIKVKIEVNKHQTYTTRGMDLITTKKVFLKDLILGGTLEFTGLDQTKFNVQIPAGTQLEPFTAPHLGLFKDGKRGNLIINFQLLIPRLTGDSINKFNDFWKTIS